MAHQHISEHYQALVDMGSNGIRFSISDLSPPTARVMPTVYQDRSAISLYDAQYESGKKVAIPQAVIKDVLTALLQFKRTCEDFQVPHDRVRVVATEATRNALNSEDYRQQIQTATGWTVEMLPKEEEGRIGALGVASSFGSIRGLVLDLGGGSIQMTWMVSENAEVKISPKGSVSFPYGAAALMRRLGEAGIQSHDSLHKEMSANFEKALQDLEIPDDLTKAADAEGGWTLYLSGGGFRGWGYILMSLHSISPYPIPIINGFQVPKSSFLTTLESSSDLDETFRISSRRASQVPAITFLIKVLTQSIPSISQIHFAQGGIREGLLFSSLPATIRAQHPLVTATQPYAPPSTAALFRTLESSVPLQKQNSSDPPTTLTSPEMLTSIVNLLYAHASLPKDIRAAAALRSSTTGLLANANGLSHVDRCSLALVLCERWGGDVSPTDELYLAKMQELAGPQAAWWAKYLGGIAAGIGDVFPAGVVRKGEEGLVQITTEWTDADEGRSASASALFLTISMVTEGREGMLEDWLERMEKKGKKKNWIGGKDGWGLKVTTLAKKLNVAR
ncbi:MAG: hypothetical protein L6R37_005040 [Teloschistes peruensis]|nr:MAG: hypothetical protein L6R37_005040 [Teloschistes peruensis]